MAYAKDFLLVCVYPLIVFIGKKFISRAEDIEKTQRDHTVRLSVTEANIRNLTDDMKELKISIDKLPSRIKQDLRDILNGRK